MTLFCNRVQTDVYLHECMKWAFNNSTFFRYLGKLEYVFQCGIIKSYERCWFLRGVGFSGTLTEDFQKNFRFICLQVRRKYDADTSELYFFLSSWSFLHMFLSSRSKNLQWKMLMSVFLLFCHSVSCPTDIAFVICIQSFGIWIWIEAFEICSQILEECFTCWPRPCKNSCFINCFQFNVQMFLWDDWRQVKNKL